MRDSRREAHCGTVAIAVRAGENPFGLDRVFGVVQYQRMVGAGGDESLLVVRVAGNSSSEGPGPAIALVYHASNGLSVVQV